MALIKIYTENKNREEVLRVAKVAKMISAAALNCDAIPTGLNMVETVLGGEGLDLVDIDYTFEIIVARGRNNESKAAKDIASGLSKIFPNKYFHVYFIVHDDTMLAEMPHQEKADVFLTMDEAIELARKENVV